MDKNNIKLELMQQLMLTESEELLMEVQKLIDNHTQSFQLTDAHKRILDDRRKRHQSGESASYSWEEILEKIHSSK
ncbi:hypothetical protein BH09BAC1_BH09BAC1_10630 [soil metagenome]